MQLTDIQLVVQEIRFPGWSFKTVKDDRGTIYLQGVFLAPCVETGAPHIQHTRRWLLSPAMTRSEIVQTALKCVLTAAEHEVREKFTYKGRAIFGPHYDVDVLHHVCQHTDARPQPVGGEA
jgi:hypothetical protein